MAGSIPEYDELKLRVESANGSYRVIAFGPDGGTATGQFTTPISQLELDNFILRVGRPRSVRSYRSSHMEEAKELGRELFEHLLAEDVGDVYHGARAVADSRGRGLRLSLSMTGAPELLEIPWELLYDPDEAFFLSQSIYTPVVRSLDLKSPREPAKVTLPLKVLALVSAPEGFVELDAATERANLETALGPLTRSGTVQLEWLESATLSELDRRIAAPDELHIVHYIGHGAYDEKGTQAGILVLEDEQGRPDEVTGDDLGGFMRDERSLQLVVLNSCEGARSSHVDPFSGVASSLLRSGLPAVIGMQTEITDKAAITFSDRLYTALAQGFPIDAALAQARRAIFAAGGEVEFGTPVLFMRVADGRLFDVDGAPPPPPVGRVDADLRAEPATAQPGATVTWRLEIRNTGDSELADVIARDTDGETRAGPLALDPGATHEITWQQRVQSDVEECATVGGRGSDGRVVSTQARAHVHVSEREHVIPPPPGPHWGRIAGIGVAALVVIGAVLAVAGVFDSGGGGGGDGGGGGGGTKAEFTAFPVHADVIDLDARADKVAFITPAQGGNGKEIRRLDLGGGPPETVTQVAPKYEGVDVGSDGSDHARLVYSSCDAANVCQLFRKPFTDVAKPVPVSRPGCSDARPSMWKDMILFARKGPACDQPGLWLKPAGSAPLEKVTGANGGADLNNGRLVWFVPGRGLFAKDVDTSGKLSAAGAREPPAGEAFIPPIVVDGDYAYFVHEQGGKDFIARAALPFDKSPIEHYVAGPEDVGADEAPHFGVTGGILYITNYPRPNGDPGSRMVLRVRNPVFERAE
jgi:hypothetical protein